VYLKRSTNGSEHTARIAKKLLIIFIVVHIHLHQMKGSKELEIES
jgi:hypothetical protein